MVDIATVITLVTLMSAGTPQWTVTPIPLVNDNADATFRACRDLANSLVRRNHVKEAYCERGVGSAVRR